MTGWLAVSPVDQGALATGASVAATAAGGLGFWLLAAHRFPAGEVGAALGLFQILLFVGYLTQLGLPVVIAHLAPGRSERSTGVFVLTVRIRVVATATVGAVVLAVAWPSGLMDPFRDAPWPLWATVFVALATATGVGTLAEVRLVTLRMWRSVIVRAVVPAAARLPLLLALPPTAGAALLFAVAAAPVAVTGLVAAVWLRSTVDRDAGPAAGRVGAARLIRYASVNWLSMLATEAPVFLAPVIVAASLSALANASFLVAWNIAAITFLVPHMVSQVVLSEASATGEVVPVARRSYLLCQSLTCVATVAAWLGAGLVADVYGPSYGAIRDQLPVLVGANIAWVVTATSLAVARAREEGGVIIGLGLVFAVTTLAPTAVTAPVGGASAAAWSWFAGNCVTAAVAGWVHRDLWLAGGAGGGVGALSPSRAR